MRQAFVVVGIVVLLTGCSDSGADPTANVGDGPSGTGTLRGVVVDDAVRPLGGAAVTATGVSGTFNATTGADGLFLFAGLAPGLYVVQVTKQFYSSHQQAVDVREGDDDPPVAKFQLAFQASSVPYANVYKYDGFYECGLYTVRVCSNINIATWIVLCANTGICLGNVTQDHSLFFQYIDPGPSFIQTEMVWTPTLSVSPQFGYLIGGGTEEELKEGVGLPAYNGTNGPSPLMLRISNHEGPDAWCVRNDQCDGGRVLDNSSLGTDRALLVQVDAGPSLVVSEDPCGVPDLYEPDPCGVGLVVQQPYTMFTIVFYGYEPPLDWLFSTLGATPPPPT